MRVYYRSTRRTVEREGKKGGGYHRGVQETRARGSLLAGRPLRLRRLTFTCFSRTRNKNANGNKTRKKAHAQRILIYSFLFSLSSRRVTLCIPRKAFGLVGTDTSPERHQRLCRPCPSQQFPPLFEIKCAANDVPST